MKTGYRNGVIWCQKGVFADHLIVENGKVVNGNEADVWVDLQGRLILPGFHDSHLHLLLTGLALSDVDLKGTTSIQEVQNRIRSHMQSHPDLKLIHGMGWNQENFQERRMLEKADLDAINPDIPMIMERCCTHVLSANTTAMKMADKIHENGIFKEEDCFPFLGMLAQDPELCRQAVCRGAAYALQNGLTSVQTADLKADNWKILLPVYNEVQIPRIFHQVNIVEENKFEELENSGDPKKLASVKGFADGSLGAWTAAMKEPYLDKDTTGILTMNLEEMETFCRWAKKKNKRVLFHAIGNQAIQNVADTYQKFMELGNPYHWGIIHTQITDQNLLDQLIENHIDILAQPIFLNSDRRILHSRLSEELASTSYAFGLLKEKGLCVSLGTDSPIETLNPMENLYHALTGISPMSLEEALDAYTYQPALQVNQGGELGRLLPGYIADFVIVDNLFELPVAEIPKARVYEVYSAGKKVA